MGRQTDRNCEAERRILRLFAKTLLENSEVQSGPIRAILVLGIEVVCCCFCIRQFHKLILQVC
jgi:hypothetical protein